MSTEAAAGTRPPLPEQDRWIPVCRYEDLLPERGVAALLGERQVALFRLHDGSVHAVQQLDPFSGAQVMSRGIVGTRGELPTVAAPMYKQVFDLRTGRCLDQDQSQDQDQDQPPVCLQVYPVQVRAGIVQVDLGAEGAGEVSFEGGP